MLIHTSDPDGRSADIILGDQISHVAGALDKHICAFISSLSSQSTDDLIHSGLKEIAKSVGAIHHAHFSNASGSKSCPRWFRR